MCNWCSQFSIWWEFMNFSQDWKFPFLFLWILDEQNCILKFASWTYDSARIDLSQKTNIGDLSNLMANSGRLRLFAMNESRWLLGFRMGYYQITCEKECGEIFLLYVENDWEECFWLVFIWKLGPETFPDLTYIVQMRRRPLFYVFNLILPCFLITTVAFLGFCVPSDSGKRHTNIHLISLKILIFFRWKSLHWCNNSSVYDSFSHACYR